MPMGMFGQIKLWFSKKRENYGYTTKLSVHAEVVAVLMAPYHRSGTTDVAIAKEFLNIRLNATKKKRGRRNKGKHRPKEGNI